MLGYKVKEEHAAQQIVILRKGGREYNPCSQEDKTPLNEGSKTAALDATWKGDRGCCFKCIISFNQCNSPVHRYFRFMEVVTEAQRDICDLPQSPQPGHGRAVVEDPVL